MKFTFVPCVVLAMAVSVSGQSAADWVGYGGPNGQRIYPGSPPIKFDHRTGEGVLWETALPVWGHGQPVAVGGKVFVMCEVGPDNVFPLLVCLDGKTGEILWRKEVDHLPAVTKDAAKQAELRRRVKAWFDGESKIINQGKGGGKRGPKPTKDRKQGQELKALYDEMGLMHDKFRRDQYMNSYSCFGDAFGTPVSDGKHIYAQTTWGGFVCYDLAGNEQWVTYARGGFWTWCNIGRSPILHKGVLYSNNGGTMRAIDGKTGKVLWTHGEETDKARGGFNGGGAYSFVSPAVITTGGKDVLLAAGPAAYLLPEGRKLNVEGWVSEGVQILVHPDHPDVAYFCGSGEHCGWKNKGKAEVQPPAAFRFTLEGDTLKGELLWHGGSVIEAAGLKGRAMGEVWGGNGSWMAVHDGKFFHRGGAILDAMTGKILAGKFGRFGRATPQTHHMYGIADGRIYGLDKGGVKGTPSATMEVFDLNGKKLATNYLVRKTPTAAQQAMHAYCTGNPKVWMEGRRSWFSYGCAFTIADDRIYIRSLESLICVGKR